jgi:hypothetical protein
MVKRLRQCIEKDIDKYSYISIERQDDSSPKEEEGEERKKRREEKKAKVRHRKQARQGQDGTSQDEEILILVLVTVMVFSLVFKQAIRERSGELRASFVSSPVCLLFSCPCV